MSLRDDVSHQLAALRSEAGLSLGQVGAKLGLSRSAWNDWERGKNGGTLDALKRMVGACGGTIHLLIGRPATRDQHEAAVQLAHMSPADAGPLLRVMRAFMSLSPFEREMIARMAEVRVEAIAEAQGRDRAGA